MKKILSLIALVATCVCAFGQPYQRNWATTNLPSVVSNIVASITPTNVIVTTNSGTLTARVLVGNGARGVTPAAASGAVPVDADGSATTAAQLVTLTGGTFTTNNATLTSGRVQVGDGGRGVANATASGSVPIDADGTATTFAQVNTLAPGAVLTNGHSVAVTVSNTFTVDDAHSFAGPGSSLTALNASQLSSGTIPTARQDTLQNTFPAALTNADTRNVQIVNGAQIGGTAAPTSGLNVSNTTAAAGVQVGTNGTINSSGSITNVGISSSSVSGSSAALNGNAGTDPTNYAFIAKSGHLRLNGFGGIYSTNTGGGGGGNTYIPMFIGSGATGFQIQVGSKNCSYSCSDGTALMDIDKGGNISKVSFAGSVGVGSQGVTTITTSATGATNTTAVNQIIYVTAATSATLKDNAGTTEFSGVTISAFTPIRIQPSGTFIGTSITYATGTASHAW